MSISEFFKKAEDMVKIASSIGPCIKAFKGKSFNSKEAVDLSVSIADKILKDYGLNGQSIKYLENFAADSIKVFSKISSDIKDHDYLKVLTDFKDSSEKLIEESKQSIVAIKADVKTVKSGENKAIKEFNSDTAEAGVELLENIINATCSTVEASDTPKDEL